MTFKVKEKQFQFKLLQNIFLVLIIINVATTLSVKANGFTGETIYELCTGTKIESKNLLRLYSKIRGWINLS